MINFDSLTLKSLLSEIAPIIENARVQKIRQPSKQEIVLTLRNNSKNYNLFISIKPSFAHICFIEDKNKQFRLIENPMSPPMFCMLLRKYLENSKIDKVVQPEFERIIEFHFTAYGDLGESIKLIFAVELMGKHSNMILYNALDKNILGCAHNVGEDKSKLRELAGNLPYIYPPKIFKKDILKLDKTDFLQFTKTINKPLSEWLNENFYDISIPLAKEFCEKFNIPAVQNESFILKTELLEKLFDEIQKVLSLKDLQPSISTDCQRFSLNGIYENKFSTVNEMTDFYFGKNSFNEMFERKRKSLLSVVEREIKKVKRLEKKLSLGKEFDEKIQFYKEAADTLMANIYLKYFDKQIAELTNIYTSETMKIEIDNNLSISDNAQNYYKLYTKAKKTKVINSELFEKYKEKENYLLSIKSAINLASDMQTLTETEEETSLLTLKNNKRENKKVKKIIVEQQTVGDFQIFTGKNNKQNDYIVSKLSAPEDFWFHVQNDFGAHILVKPKYKTETLPDDILLKAAKSAAMYSERKNDKKVNVIYTKRKYIKKPPKANLGYVIYKNEKEITVEVE